MASNAHRVDSLRALRALLAKHEQGTVSADLEAVRWRALASLHRFHIRARDAEIVSSYKHVIARGGVAALDQVLHSYGFVAELPELVAHLGQAKLWGKNSSSSLVAGRSDWMIPLASAPSAVRACAGTNSIYALLRDGTLCEIDRGTGETTGTWTTTPPRGPRLVFAVMASPKLAVIASGDELAAWDLATPMNLWTAQDSGGRVQALFALEDDGTLLQWDATGRLTLRDALSGKVLTRSPSLAPGLRRVCAAAVTPSQVIGVGGDGRAYVIGMPSLECSAIDLPGKVYDCALSVTGDVALFATVTTAGANEYALLETSLLDAPLQPRWFAGEPAHQVSVSPRGEHVLQVRAGEHARLVSSTGQVERELPKIESFFCDVIMEEGECLIAGGELSEIRGFNLKKTRPLPEASHRGLVTGIKPFGNGHCISIANEVVRWDLATGQRLETLPLPGDYWDRNNFEYAGASRVALGARGTDVDVVTVTGDAVQRLTGHEGGVALMRTSSDGTRLATVSVAGRVRIWDCTRPADLPLMQQLDARAGLGTPYEVYFAAGNAALVCRYERGVAVWDLARGTDATPNRVVELGSDAAFVVLPRPGLCIAIDPDGGAAVCEGNHEATQAYKFDEPVTHCTVVADERLVIVTSTGTVHVVSAEVGKLKWKYLVADAAQRFDARNTQLCPSSDGRYFGVAQTWQMDLFSSDHGIVGSWFAVDPLTAGLVASDGSAAIGDVAGNIQIIGRL